MGGVWMVQQVERKMSPLTLLSKTVFLSVSLCVPLVSGMTVIEVFVGGSVVLPCTLTPNGDLNWKQGAQVILIKPASGAAMIPESLYKRDVSLVNSADLRISPLRRNRDGQGNKIFECGYTGGGEQQLELILLARIAGVSILETIKGKVTVTAGISKTLTCTVTGDPNPTPSYSWSVDDVTVSGQTSNFYTFVPDKSMRTIKCTASNRYSNESVLSVMEATATLDVIYLEPAKSPVTVTVIENDRAALKCSAEGNPPPNYEWRRSGSSDVGSKSADYIIENVHRSAAGGYTCRVYNTIDSNSVTANLIVQYPPDVTVSHADTTLTCTAEGVPRNYSFSQWEHRLDGKLLQTLGTPSSGSTATLKLPDTLTYEDTGNYVCQVSNGIKSPQRGQVSITPQTPAIFEGQTSRPSLAIEGEIGTIYVPFYTYSDTPNVTVVWMKSGDSAVLTSNRENTGPVRLMIHGQSVILQGIVTVLTVNGVSGEGNYTVTVTNDINGALQSNQMSLYVNAQNSSDSPGPQASTGVAPIAGGVAGVLVLFIAVVIVIVVLVKRRKTKEPKYTEKVDKVGKPITPQSEKVVQDENPTTPSQSEKVANVRRPKKAGLNYQEVEIANGGKDPTVHPRQDPVTYADIRFIKGKSTTDDTIVVKVGDNALKEGKSTTDDTAIVEVGDNAPKEVKSSANDPTIVEVGDNALNENKVPANVLTEPGKEILEEKHPSKNFKKAGLNYQQVEIDNTKDNVVINPRENPVTYADISFVKNEKM